MTTQPSSTGKTLSLAVSILISPAVAFTYGLQRAVRRTWFGACLSGGALTRFYSKAAFLGLALMTSSMSPAFAQQQVALPNGATALQETYQDWRLSCVVQNNARTCTLLQDQSQQNGQRLLAVEIRSGSGGAFATLLLPFGILLDAGITPQIDGQAQLPLLHFRTCLPTGCVAEFPIDAATLQKLRAGSSLKLQVTTAAETKLTFPISLRGLAAALDRMASLAAG